MQNFFVAGWVNKDSGALGFEFNGEHQPFPLLTRVPFAKPISNVSATLYHTLFLTADGEVYTCGSNVAMRAGGLMNDERILHPTRIEFFNTHKLRVVNCYAFDRGSVFCTSDGSMWYCGRLSTTNLQTAQQLSVHVTRVATSYPSYTHLTFVNYNITILAQDGYVYYKDVDQATKQDLPFTRSTIPNGNIKELYEYRLLNTRGEYRRFLFYRGREGIIINDTASGSVHGEEFVHLSFPLSGKVVQLDEQYTKTVGLIVYDQERVVKIEANQYCHMFETESRRLFYRHNNNSATFVPFIEISLPCRERLSYVAGGKRIFAFEPTKSKDCLTN